jgi:hypothetical protein
MSHIPPKVPESEADLNRVVQLLGLRMQSCLNKDQRTEIKELVGSYPTPAQAVVWKQAIKRQMSHMVVVG